MQRGFQSVLYGFGAVAIAALGLVTALEVSIAAIPTPPGVDATTIDRANKGDRLPVTREHRAVQPGQEPKLPEGCVSASAWHKTTIYSAEIAGRCVV